MRNRIFVPAVSGDATGKYTFGRFIWHDLLTDDVASAREFYRALFGWEFKGRGGDDAPYLTAYMDDIPVAGIVKSDPLESGKSESRWIGYISVADINHSVGQILSLQGIVFMPPRELSERGMVALAGDPRGAYFGLITTREGDPEEGEVPLNGWLWNELMSTDPDTVVDFYRAVFDYIPEKNNENYILLKTGNKEQAGITQISIDHDTAVWLPYLRVADLTQVLTRAESLGGKTIFDPRIQSSKRSAAVLADPTGAIFGVQEWP